MRSSAISSQQAAREPIGIPLGVLGQEPDHIPMPPPP